MSAKQQFDKIPISDQTVFDDVIMCEDVQRKWICFNCHKLRVGLSDFQSDQISGVQFSCAGDLRLLRATNRQMDRHETKKVGTLPFLPF